MERFWKSAFTLWKIEPKMAKLSKKYEGFSRDVEVYWTIIEEICHYLMKLVKMKKWSVLKKK